MFSTLGYYICIPFAWILRLFYNLTNSYGLALILFTLVVKLVLLPFQLKSKKSMIRMNRFQPKMREIYRLNEEKLSPGYDIVVVARVKAVHSRYDQLERQFLSLANKLGLLTPEGPVL